MKFRTARAGRTCGLGELCLGSVVVVVAFQDQLLTLGVVAEFPRTRADRVVPETVGVGALRDDAI